MKADQISMSNSIRGIALRRIAVRSIAVRSMALRILVCLAAMVSWTAGLPMADAAILTSGFFSNTIDRYDPDTGAQSVFATVPAPSALNPIAGLAGLAFDVANNRVLASTRFSDRVYSFNALTGAQESVHQLSTGFQPAGLAVGADGRIYVAQNSGNDIAIFDSAFNSVGTITTPNVSGVPDFNNFVSNMAFDSSGDLIISTLGGVGLFRHDFTSDTTSFFAAGSTSSGQVAIQDDGTILVGGATFTNDVQAYAADGTAEGPFVTIGDSILPEPPLGFGSFNATQPGGVTIDNDGNILVAALGRTNPFGADDNFQSNGGLFKFDPGGNLIETFAVQSAPYSSVIVVNAVPEPTAIAVLLIGGVALVVRRSRRRQRAGNAA